MVYFIEAFYFGGVHRIGIWKSQTKLYLTVIKQRSLLRMDSYINYLNSFFLRKRNLYKLNSLCLISNYIFLKAESCHCLFLFRFNYLILLKRTLFAGFLQKHQIISNNI